MMMWMMHLPGSRLPAGLEMQTFPKACNPEVEPPYGPTGEVFRYTLTGKNYSIRDLTTFQDWVLDRQLKSVPGVADVNSFGGEEKTFEISVNPNLLNQYNLSSLDVYSAVAKSNLNVGGDVIERNGQAFVVRGIGLLNNISDIENIIITNINGVPILVKNIGTVKEAGKPRLGQVSRDFDKDVIEGIVVIRKGENPKEALDRIHAKVKDLNDNILPRRRKNKYLL